MSDPQGRGSAAPAALEAKHLFRSAPGRCIVRDLSLRLRRGEVVGLLGPNGAGKSTTLRLLAGVLVPEGGRITVQGRVLDRAARRHIGYLPEEPPLYPELTVDEQLLLAARLAEIPRRACRAAIARVKARCALDTMGRRLVGRLSKGYRQRVGLAQALLGDPPILLLDEPTVGLDPVQLREVRELVHGLRADHAVLLSTHVLPEAQAVCDRVLILVDGRIVHESALGATAEASRYRVRFARDPGAAALEALQGVDAVARAGVAPYRVRLRDDTALDRLLAQASAAGWGLRTLEPEGNSLEALFMHYAFGAGEAA